MNCNSFFPGYYNSTRSPNLEFNGSSWPDNIPISGYNCRNVFSFSYPDQHLGHYMEALKSTMLKQEAVFKDQIHELHRVYWRQKELMVEMKGTGLNPVLYENSYENVPRTVNNPGFRWMNPCTRSCIKRSETSETSDERSKQVGLDLNIGSKRSCKVFDLELPAHEFIGVEEKEISEEDKVCKVFPGKIFGFQITSDKRSSSECLVRDPDLWETKVLLDLNKPIKIEEEEEDSESNDSAAPATGFQIPSSKTVDESEQISRSEAEKAQAVLFSDDDEDGTGIDLNSSPEDSCKVSSLLNKRQDSFMVTQTQSHPCLNGLASSRKRSGSSIKTTCSAKRSRLCFVPVSPENKESARPSVESDNNQSSLGKENLDSSRDVESVQTMENKELNYLSAEDDEPKRTAAEIIVDISSSCSQFPWENFAGELEKPSFCVNLDWFATIALSVNEDTKPEFGSSLREYEEDTFSDEMDYFEAMTLQLTETEEEEHFKKTEKGHTVVIGSHLVDGSVRKGPSRRAKRHHKNFQTEVLTSLACLSRKEVTRDLQMIGGLMEATGTKRESVSTRKKKTKNVISSKNKRFFGSRETVLSSYDKIDVRIDMGWGKITRRARGPRSAAANFQVNIGEVE